jgi:hypothetical protein
MVDYNQDGKNDLFCYGIGGIKVYKNVGDAINGIQWEVAKDLLYSDNWGADLNLYVSSADIPAIVDVDGDSDIDVLTYHIGGQHLQYHKNMSMENYGVPDSLEFVLMNECWGKFREDVNTNSLFLNDNTPPCAEGNVPNPESPIQNPNLEKLKPTEQTPKHEKYTSQHTTRPHKTDTRQKVERGSMPQPHFKQDHKPQSNNKNLTTRKHKTQYKKSIDWEVR